MCIHEAFLSWAGEAANNKEMAGYWPSKKTISLRVYCHLNYVICFVWHHSHRGVGKVVVDGQDIFNNHDDLDRTPMKMEKFAILS